MSPDGLQDGHPDEPLDEAAEDRQASTATATGPVVLGPWRAFKDSRGKLHIASELKNGAVRVTSALSGVDRHHRIAKTRSGRLYLFVTPPEEDAARCERLGAYAGRAGLAGAKDVSEKFWKAIDGAEAGLDNPAEA